MDEIAKAAVEVLDLIQAISNQTNLLACDHRDRAHWRRMQGLCRRRQRGEEPGWPSR